MDGVELRAATSTHSAVVAAFHHAVWQASFRELAPLDVQERLDHAHRLTKWTKALSQPRQDQLVLLAEQAGKVVGMGAASAPSSSALGDRGEIFAVYVDPLCQGKGFGTRLMSALAQHLRDCGYKGAALAVVAGNDAALSFYQSLGGVCIGTATDVGPIWRSKNIIMGWNDLTRLTG